MILVSPLLIGVVNVGIVNVGVVDECADRANRNRGISEQVDECSAFVLRGGGGIDA
jgi:hypothetical protein